MISIDELVARAKKDNATDVHLIFDLPPKYRIDGWLQDMYPDRLTIRDCEFYARWLAGDEYKQM